jgi:bifunctional DNA-binding transcriptional regulator/antitoxin component of YhaV-PrlF toxin-antitoxin module
MGHAMPLRLWARPSLSDFHRSWHRRASGNRAALMTGFMVMKTRIRVTRGGQISIPASIRHRWRTSTLTLDDRGDRLVLEPAADDPIAAAEGALAREISGRFDLARLRREARARETSAEARRSK